VQQQWRDLLDREPCAATDKSPLSPGDDPTELAFELGVILVEDDGGVENAWCGRTVRVGTSALQPAVRC